MLSFLARDSPSRWPSSSSPSCPGFLYPPVALVPGSFAPAEVVVGLAVAGAVATTTTTTTTVVVVAATAAGTSASPLRERLPARSK
jgi:hypothetical protein